VQKLIEKHKVIVCIGTGGVGKTTIAASIAIKAALMGKRTLVVTIDPARRLSQALGIDATAEIVNVKLDGAEDLLFAGMLSAEKTFERYIVKSTKSEEAASRIMQNKLYRQLSSKLSGSQEFTSLLDLLDFYKSGKYDLIVLDTPPSQHAIDFLKAPERIYSLFQNQITQWFSVPSKKDGFMSRVFQKSTQAVLSVFERVTGDEFMEELTDFFQALSVLQDSIKQNSYDSDQLLKSHESSFVLVTNYDKSKLKAANIMDVKLQDRGYALSKIIINKAFPLWFKNTEESDNEQPRWPEDAQLYYEESKKYYGQQSKVYDSFFKDSNRTLGSIEVPQMEIDLKDLVGLKIIAEKYLN
jgi:anion-transporting  ArsA/GET3 family ATPase